MSSAKTLRLLSLAIMASGALISCRPKPIVTPDPVPLTLSAQVMSLDYEDNSLWGKKAELGVFVTESGTSKLVGENGNVRHYADFKTGIIPLTPSDKPVILPEDNMDIDIAAYYPYTSELSSSGESEFVYQVDLQDQNALDPEVLLVARIEKRNSVLHTAMLTMKPAFAKLKVNLRNQTDVKSSESETEVCLEGIPCEAGIDILNGRYVSYGSETTTTLARPIDTAHSYEAVVLAHTVSDNARLLVSISESGSRPEEKISLLLKDVIKEFKTNTQYDVTVTVSPEGVDATLVGMSDFFVSDWKEDFEDVNGEID